MSLVPLHLAGWQLAGVWKAKGYHIGIQLELIGGGKARKSQCFSRGEIESEVKSHLSRDTSREV